MKVGPGCEKCLYDKQKKAALSIEEERKREAFLAEIREILGRRRAEDSAPYLVSLFRKVYEKYTDRNPFPADVMREYNDLILSMEKTIEDRIEGAADPLERAIVYARIGNYIDFGAMNTVERGKLLEMLEDGEESLEREAYVVFCRECAEAKKFLLLCDNCGEIVLDKLFLRQLKKRFPQLEVTAMVREEAVLNDATMKDAEQSGMTEEATVISNGNDVAGTVWEFLTPRARRALEEADVILAKGQGNYESLSGYPGTVYYSFLCKCDLFTERFQVPRLTGMFVRESR